jgi:hypothetical protein
MKRLIGLLALCAIVNPARAFEVAQDASNLTFSAGSLPVLSYRHSGYPFKPYVAQLCTPAGVAVLRDSPSDHKHHHGLMFAVEAAGVDFWGEFPGRACGQQRQQKLESSATGLTQTLDWAGTNGVSILHEERRIKLHAEPGLPATLVTWQTTLAAAPGQPTVTLGGHHYYGLGARFVNSLDKVAKFQNAAGAAGEIVRGDERLTAARWCAVTGPVDGKPITCALFDHPANPRHPNRMFTMAQPFAYLSATLNLWKAPFALKAGQPLRLCYGIALCDGAPAAAEIEKLYQLWLTNCGVPAP